MCLGVKHFARTNHSSSSTFIPNLIDTALPISTCKLHVFLARSLSSFISLDPHLACYLLPRILHLCEYNYSFFLCLWVFKFWTDPGTSEGKCIYQFDAWPEWLIINVDSWICGIHRRAWERRLEQHNIFQVGEKKRNLCQLRGQVKQIFSSGRTPPGCIFTLPEHATVKRLPLQMAISLWPCVPVCDTMCH